MLWLWHIMSGADAAARAADRLFPSNFASRMFLVSSAVLIFTWGEFLIGNVSTSTLFAGGITLAGAGIIIVILHPQRLEKVWEKKEQEDKENRKCEVPAMAAAATDGETALNTLRIEYSMRYIEETRTQRVRKWLKYAVSRVQEAISAPRMTT